MDARYCSTCCRPCFMKLSGMASERPHVGRAPTKAQAVKAGHGQEKDRKEETRVRISSYADSLRWREMVGGRDE